MKSESIKELSAALVAAQGEFSAVVKGNVNPFFKSKYAALPDVIASATPVLVKHGLAVTQFMSEDDTLTTYLLHSSGEFISHASSLHLVKNDPQSHGSATTYARRYAYMSCLGLVADEDDDGNKASGRQKKSESPGGSQSHQSGDSGETQGSKPELGALTPLHEEIKAHPKYKEMASDAKGLFLTNSVGYQVTSIRQLSDADCEQVLAALRAL
jgi:hypothetical protein